MNSLFVADSIMGECVILLHGMGRTSRSMHAMETRLERLGYRVWNQTYPSTSSKVEDMAEAHINQGLAYCAEAGDGVVHFVTHSLGGIMLRYFLRNNSIEMLGNIVMLAPPNRGSEVADMLKNNWLYRKATGPAGQQLGTGMESLPNQLGPITGNIGIIAGCSSSDPWFSPMIPGQDDGKVSVARARLDEMSDFLVVEAGHTFIMAKSVVIEQVAHFLANGRFNHSLDDDFAD